MHYPLVTTELVPLQEITEIDRVAATLRSGMLDGTNKDLVDDFAYFIEDFCPTEETAVFDLWERQQLSDAAWAQTFIAFAGQRAVGLAVVEAPFDAPKGVPEDWPTLWHFVVNPWRGQGFGRKILEASLEVVEKQYDGKAWTVARIDNTPSRSNLQKAGFRFTGLTAEEKPQCIYTYGVDQEVMRRVWLEQNAGITEDLK